jgi:hypothetical protein
MIETATINGRPAVVSYLNQSFQPVDQAIATLLKVTFTDDEGGIVFATLAPSDGA